MNISIVIATYNRAYLLDRCLLSLLELRIPEGLKYEILIVDNASTDNTKEVLDELAKKVVFSYLYEPKQGQSNAINYALKQARGELILLTDDDVAVDKYWLQEYWHVFKQKPGYDWFGGCVLADWKLTPRPRWYSEQIKTVLDGCIGLHQIDTNSRQYTVDDKLPIGASMAVTKKLVDDIGLFRGDLGPSGNMRGGSGDTEYLARAQNAGYSGAYVSEAVVSHYVESSRLSINGFFQYGKAKGINAKRYTPEAYISSGYSGMIDQVLRAMYQLIKGRLDRVRVCALNVGFQLGVKQEEGRS